MGGSNAASNNKNANNILIVKMLFAFNVRCSAIPSDRLSLISFLQVPCNPVTDYL